jgi:geranylgeranyl diphosphate synthase type II
VIQRQSDDDSSAPVVENSSAAPAIAIPAAAAPGRVTLPAKVPLQILRPTQSNVPATKRERDRLKIVAAQLIKDEGVVPPLSMKELRDYGTRMCEIAEIDEVFQNYCSVLVNNESWRDELAQVPYERRLLLLPKCLRLEEHCPAPFDQFGLLCKDCGLCSIQDLSGEAHRLGYAVLVAEGSAIVRGMIETGKIEAIVGVSCLNVLEKCFPHMEAVAIPGMSIPLLQDDCINTNVDMDHVWDLIHLTSEDKTYRLDLDVLKDDVKSWFTPESLAELMGPVPEQNGETDKIGREWLARAGNRWRPYLTTCVHLALQFDGTLDEQPELTADIKRLAIAVECFHKASLIHDDIEDGDQERYGEDALHVEYGIPVALNVGDFLLGEGYRLIAGMDCDAERRAAMLAEAARGHVSLSRGQGAELCWARAPRALTSLEVLGIFKEKTAPAFEVALRLGGIYGSADDATASVLSEYSESLGIAYQIRDDVEDFSGSSDSDDLADLRPSLILAIAHKLAHEGAEKDLMESLWRREASVEDVRGDVDTLLKERRVLEKARELRDAYEQQAIASLRTLTNPTLKGLLRRVIGKIFGNDLIEGYCGEFEARNAPGRTPGSNPA